MNNADIINLDPQHIAELKSFFKGFQFANVDIVARELAVNDSTQDFVTCDFSFFFNSLKLDGIFRGKDHMHAIFAKPNDDDDTFYCVSYAIQGNSQDRIIFKLSR